jgi:hypothetical protein
VGRLEGHRLRLNICSLSISMQIHTFAGVASSVCRRGCEDVSRVKMVINLPWSTTRKMWGLLTVGADGCKRYWNTLLRQNWRCWRYQRTMLAVLEFWLLLVTNV